MVPTKLILFSLVLFFSTTNFANNKCENLFEPNKLNINLDEVHYNGIEVYDGYRETFSKLSDTFRKFFDSKSVDEKNKLKIEIDSYITSIQNNIALVLDQKGILYELTPAFAEYTDYYKLSWSFFKIKTDGSHWLNKMAHSVKTKLDVDLAYDPISLSIMGFGGAFWQFKKTLTLFEDSITLPRISYVEGHELIHAHFWGYRIGRTKFPLGKAPVHIEMRSTPNIDKNADPMATVYQNYMSFEEMVTFSYNILFSGKDFQSKAGSITKSKLLYEIAKLKQISKNAIIAADLGLDLIQKKIFSNLTHENLNYLLLGKQDAEFGMNIFIDRSSMQPPEVYAENQLLLAKRLAAFNLEKLNSVELLSDSQLLDFALTFRDLQKDFIFQLQ